MNSVTVVPLIGAYPITHMGHVYDLAQSLTLFPGRHKVIGLSSNNNPLDWQFRFEIFQTQLKEISGQITVIKSSCAGESLARSRKFGENLNILVGGDRINFAERLKMGLEEGAIHEMKDMSFKSISIHTTTDVNRKHGLSGTRMREAIKYDDFETFWIHLGLMFSEEKAREIYEKLRSLDIKVKRKH